MTTLEPHRPEGAATHPDEVPALLRRAQEAELDRDLPAAFTAYRRVLKAQPQNARASRGVLRIAMKRRYYGAAARLLHGRLHGLDCADAQLAKAQIGLRSREWQAALRLANRFLARTDTPDGARRHMEAVRSRAIAQRRAESSPPEFRHIAIGGVSFSGSTVLAALLGSAPDAFNIGESHHLIERVDPATASSAATLAISGGKFEWGRDSPARLFPCHACGPRCRLFDLPFRRSMSRQGDWYGRIAARAGTDILVSSDKNFNFINDNEPLGRLDLIILFKSPEAAWASELKNKDRLRRLRLDRPALHRPVEKYLLRWSENYLSLMRGLNPTGKVVALSWEAFCAAPEWHLRRLAGLLQLEIGDDPMWLREGQHFFGGNIEVRHDQLSGSGRLNIRPVSPLALPPVDRAVIEADRETRYVFAMLRDRYRRAFGARFLPPAESPPP